VEPTKKTGIFPAAALFALFASLASARGPAAPPAIPETVRVRLAEAFALATEADCGEAGGARG